MILALDLGSTSFKAAVLDDSLQPVGHGSEAIRYHHGAAGEVEISIPLARRAVRNSLAAALRQAGLPASALTAIAITSQAQTFTIVDRRRRALLPFLSWQDGRAEAACRRLQRLKAMDDFPQHASFGTILPALQLSQLAHLRQTRPEVLHSSHRIQPLPTYFIAQWTGRFVTDENLAAMSGLFSIPMRSWWPAALRATRVEAAQLPEVQAMGSMAGITGRGAKAFGLPCGLPVVLAGNDQTAGGYAAGLREKKAVLLTLGTAQVAYQFSTALPRPHPSLVRGPFPRGGFYAMAADGWGGNLIQWAKTILADGATDEAFFQLVARGQPGCQGLRLEPEAHANRFAWRQLSPHHTSADLARSVIECLCHRLAALLAELGPAAARQRVLVAGGGRLSSAWLAILSQTLGGSIHPTEAQPLHGAARLAREALHAAPVSGPPSSRPDAAHTRRA